MMKMNQETCFYGYLGCHWIRTVYYNNVWGDEIKVWVYIYCSNIDFYEPIDIIYVSLSF